jgi:hypothetical protein
MTSQHILMPAPPALWLLRPNMYDGKAELIPEYFP